MHRGLVLGLIISWAPASAVAQTATCTTNGNRTICHTLRDDGLAGDGTMIGTFNQLFKKDPRKRVGKLLAKGDCDGAKRVALEAGDLTLAKEVLNYCAAREGEAHKKR